MFFITYLVGLLVTIATAVPVVVHWGAINLPRSAAKNVTVHDVTMNILEKEAIHQIAVNILKNAASPNLKPVREVIADLLANLTETDTKPTDEAIANLLQNAKFVKYVKFLRALTAVRHTSAHLSARDWQDIINPANREILFVSREDFDSAQVWYEFASYADIVRRIESGTKFRVSMAGKESSICKLVPNLGQYAGYEDMDDYDVENLTEYEYLLWVCTDLA
jgi:hypothetical protein